MDLVGDLPSLSSPSCDNDKVFRLMDLPAELRNLVYAYLLPENKHFYKTLGPTSTSSFAEKHMVPTILLTSKQMYEEAIAVLYGNNIFHVASTFYNPEFPDKAYSISTINFIAPRECFLRTDFDELAGSTIGKMITHECIHLELELKVSTICCVTGSAIVLSIGIHNRQINGALRIEKHQPQCQLSPYAPSDQVVETEMKALYEKFCVSFAKIKDGLEISWKGEKVE